MNKEKLAKIRDYFRGEVDLTTGNLFAKFIIFTIPIVLLSLLQLLYTTADVLTVDFYGGGYNSFIAVSSNGSLINLIIGLFVGVGVGANVVLAKQKGKGDKEAAERTLHSSMALSVVLGIPIAILGYFISPALLKLLDTPDEVISLASEYLQLYFIGLPFLMIFNFGSALLRAMGDSKRPLYALIICGLINVGLNLLFVIVFKMDVAGVGLATVVCEVFEATLTILFLRFNKSGYVRLSFRKLFAFYPKETQEVLANGIPAGLQSFVFSVSNVFIQASVNGFGVAAMAGNSASSQAEGYLYIILNGFSVASVAMVAQNYGAGKKENLKKILWYSLLTVTIVGLVVGGIFSLCYKGLIGLFINEKSVTSSEEYAYAIECGKERLILICMTYFLDGIMDCASAYSRGLGHPITPTIITLVGCCLLRIVFIETLFRFVPFFHTLPWIWASWPISWVIVDVIYIFVIPHYKKEAFAEIDSRDLISHKKENA
jgi:putative MATE family efflux protein